MKFTHNHQDKQSSIYFRLPTENPGEFPG